jgi:hypothetical protein
MKDTYYVFTRSDGDSVGHAAGTVVPVEVSGAELDKELAAGIESIDTGIGYSPAEVEAILAREFGV